MRMDGATGLRGDGDGAVDCMPAAFLGLALAVCGWLAVRLGG